MATHWFRVPILERTENDSTVQTPKYLDRVESGTGFLTSSGYVVRFQASQSVLDGIGDETDTDSIGSSAASDDLSTERGNSWSASQIDGSFHTSQGGQ